MTSPDTNSALAYQRRVFAWAKEVGLTTLRLGIYQPKVGGPSEWTCTMDELQAFAVDLLDRVEHVRDADTDHKTMPFDKWWPIYLNPDPDDEACAFCRAMPTCPSYQGKLQRQALVDFAVVAEGNAPAVPTSVVDIDRAMSCVPLMEAWLKAVRAEAERQLLSGVELPNWGLELGRQGNREFSDPEAAEEMMRKQFRMSIEECYTLKLKSPTQVEKLTKAAVGTKPALGVRQWAKLETLVSRADPKPSVKPKSAIKTPYTPPHLSTSGFSAVAEDDFT